MYFGISENKSKVLVLPLCRLENLETSTLLKKNKKKSENNFLPNTDFQFMLKM